MQVLLLYVGVDNDDDNGGVDNDDMIMVVLMKIKRRFFTHSLFCPRGPGGPPEAVIILNDRPLLQKTLVHYCTTDPLKCKAHFKAEKKRKRSHIYFISPLFPIQHIDVRCRIYI